jgi:hypothetical protein
LLATGKRVQAIFDGAPAMVVIVAALAVGAKLEVPTAACIVVAQLRGAVLQSRLLGWNVVVATPAELVNAVAGEKL